MKVRMENIVNVIFSLSLRLTKMFCVVLTFVIIDTKLFCDTFNSYICFCDVLTVKLHWAGQFFT